MDRTSQSQQCNCVRAVINNADRGNYSNTYGKIATAAEPDGKPLLAPAKL